MSGGAAAAALPRIWGSPAVTNAAAAAARAARLLRDSSVTDRLVRGRAWIGLLGVMLIALVGLNVSLLKLNAAAGRNAEWAKKLRVENADLRARVSRLGSGERIQASARNLGLVMPNAESVHYLRVNTALDVRRAVRRDSFVPLSTTNDIVSATPTPLSIIPTIAPAAAPPAAGTTGAQATTGTTATGPASTTTTTTTTPPAPSQSVTGTTGAQPPSTGATVP